MGWWCLTARKLALQTGAGAAMIYRLIMFISAFLFPTRAGLSVPFKLWHIITSFGASKLACQTWAGAAILPFQTEHLFRYLLFFTRKVSRNMSEISLVFSFLPFLVGIFSLACVPAALVGARHRMWLVANFRPNLIHWIKELSCYTKRWFSVNVTL